MDYNLSSKDIYFYIQSHEKQKIKIEMIHHSRFFVTSDEFFFDLHLKSNKKDMVISRSQILAQLLKTLY